MLRRFFACVLPMAAALLAAGAAFGQSYPGKPVRIVTAEAGAATDILARVIAQGLSAAWNQPVIVDNRGGNAVIPFGIIAKAPPDGYTLLVYINALWLTPLLRESATYDVTRDLSPITLAASTPNIVVVHPSLPVKSVQELIALAKAKPRALNYGSGVTGTINHLAGELFNEMAGVKMVRVPYKGAALAVNAVVAGEVDLMFATAASSMPHVKSGRLRALAVTSAQRSSLLPSLPTVASLGLPGYEAVTSIAFFAPGATPLALVNRIRDDTVQVLNRSDTRERLANIGVEVIASTPDQLVAALKAEIVRVGRVIRAAGIRAE